MNVLGVVMEFYGEIFFARMELAEVVCQDHILAGLVSDGVIIFLHTEQHSL